MGPMGHPGGAIIAKSMKQPGLAADSVPVIELGGFHHGTKDVIFARHVFEEIAGLLQKGNTDMVVEGSAPPTVCAIDNQSITNLITGISGKGKGLRHYNRTICFLRSARNEKIINPLGVSTSDQQADILTKQYKSPTAYWKAAEGPFGKHPAIDAMLDRVIRQHGRSSKSSHTPIDSVHNLTAISVNSSTFDFSSSITSDYTNVLHTVLDHRLSDDLELGLLTQFNTTLNSGAPSTSNPDQII